MATVKFGRFKANNVISLNAIDCVDLFMLKLEYANGSTANEVFKKSPRLRVELKGNTHRLLSSNCATVFGDIENAEVGNSAEIEGYIKLFQNPKNSVTINRNIKVAYGNEDRSDTPSVRARIIHIDGDIGQLCVNIHNVEVEVVVKGNCNIVNVGNCLSCKGTVKDIRAGNSIYCTMGKSKGKTKRALQKEVRKKSLEDIFGQEPNKVFDNIFGKEPNKSTEHGLFKV